MSMDLGTIKALVEIIKEGAIRGTYFRDIHPALIVYGIKSHGKNFVKE